MMRRASMLAMGLTLSVVTAARLHGQQLAVVDGVVSADRRAAARLADSTRRRRAERRAQPGDLAPALALADLLARSGDRTAALALYDTLLRAPAPASAV